MRKGQTSLTYMLLFLVIIAVVLASFTLFFESGEELSSTAEHLSIGGTGASKGALIPNTWSVKSSEKKSITTDEEIPGLKVGMYLETSDGELCYVTEVITSGTETTIVCDSGFTGSPDSFKLYDSYPLLVGHTVCEDGACVSTMGYGPDECFNDSMCSGVPSFVNLPAKTLEWTAEGTQGTYEWAGEEYPYETKNGEYSQRLACGTLFADVDGNDIINAADVQIVINGALQIIAYDPCIDLDDNGVINAVDVQLAINALRGVELTDNHKQMPLYSSDRVFLISDRDWHEVLTLIPVTTWTEQSTAEEECISWFDGCNDCRYEGEDVFCTKRFCVGELPPWECYEYGEPRGCQQGYGTAGGVCTYPTLIYHEDTGGFDADSIVYFIQQYDARKVTLVGNSPEELEALLTAAEDFGAGVSQIEQIDAWDYPNYWDSLDTVVYVEDDYETALLASTYASLKNAPLIIEGYNDKLGFAINPEMSVICVGDVDYLCDTRYTLDALQKKYIEETNTDKIILTNPEDLSISVSSDLETEKGGTVDELYSRTSLAAPILASAKHELILSTTEVDYLGVDNFIEDSFDSLDLTYLVEYLTILSAPNAVEMSYEYGNDGLSRSVDAWYYSQLSYKSELLDIAVGRIFGLTLSDVSSNIARNLFYDRTLKNPDAILVTRGHEMQDSAAKVYAYGKYFQELGYSTTYSPEGTTATDMLDKFFIYYIDHGTFNWMGVGSSTFPLLDNSFIISRACSTCYFNTQYTIGSPEALVCANLLRNGAVGFIGTTDDANGFNDVGTVFEIFAMDEDVGTALKIAKNAVFRTIPSRLSRQTTASFYSLFGDPTFHLNVIYPAPQPELEKKQSGSYDLTVPVMNVAIPESVQKECEKQIDDPDYHYLVLPSDILKTYWVFFDLDALDLAISKIDSIEVSGDQLFNVTALDVYENRLGIHGIDMSSSSLHDGMNILDLNLLITTASSGEGLLSPYAEIEFNNKDVESVVRNTIQLFSVPITRKDLVTLSSLDLSSLGLTDISFVSDLPTLQRIYLSKNDIVDISPISSLTNLKTLYLSSNGLRYLSPLVNLKDLEYLDISFNEVTNLGPLSSLSELRTLYANYNYISSVSALSNLKELESLHLNGNSISDLTPLSGLNNLKTLSLVDNLITDVSPLMGLESLERLYLGSNDEINCEQLNELRKQGVIVLCDVCFHETLDFNDKNLEERIRKTLGILEGPVYTQDLQELERLHISYNSIVNISALFYAAHLTILDASYNNIVDISPLSDLRYLESLRLSHNMVSEIPELTGLVNLEYLSLISNEVSQISDLSSLTSLKNLLLQDNQITDISALSGLTNLEDLGLSENQISDISDLSSLTSLTDLSINGNQISDISDLSSLTNLTDLNVKANKITDISPIANLHNLQSLTISDNQITDISPIANLHNLKLLTISENQISDISALSGLSELQFAYLGRNSITDISPLLSLENLQYVTLDSNPVDCSQVQQLIDNGVPVISDC